MNRRKFLKASLYSLVFATVHGANRSGIRATKDLFISSALD